MRLKTFTGATMADAIELVRAELGDDAVIVATHKNQGGKGVKITAAVESGESDEAIAKILSGAEEDKKDLLTRELEEVFKFHNIPQKLQDRLLAAATASSAVKDAQMALAVALEYVFSFAPLPEDKSYRPFLFVGPPGAGKTVCVAKLATRAALAKRKFTVISTDCLRSGGAEQLASLTKIMGVNLKLIRSPDALRKEIDENTSDLIFIDAPGLNPFIEEDVKRWRELKDAADAEAIMVMAAGIDPIEAGEIGESVEAGLKITRFIATRLDATRRLGGVFSAAFALKTPLSDATASPHVTIGLSPLSGITLAKLFFPG